MTSALQDAADLGMTVAAASGDGLATDGASDGKAHVDFPASSPLVLGCGGVRLDASAGAITAEAAWNSNGGGTGGGVSDLFPVPTYQAGVKLPADVNGAHRGRGVPDVAGDADPDTGYRVVVDGQSQVIGAPAPQRRSGLGCLHWSTRLRADPPASRTPCSTPDRKRSTTSPPATTGPAAWATRPARAGTPVRVWARPGGRL